MFNNLHPDNIIIEDNLEMKLINFEYATNVKKEQELDADNKHHF